MNSPISTRDLEQLSAYLDKALPERASIQLADRLKVEPRLAAALKQIELTRTMLRRAPQRRVPHSFILTREMAASSARSIFGSWSSFNFASAIASLLLVFTLIGDFSVNGLPAFAQAPEPAALMLSAPAEDTAGEATGAEQPTADPLAPQPPEELYAEEATSRKSGSPVTAFFTEHARKVETGLFAIALISGLVALDQKRKRGAR